MSMSSGRFSLVGDDSDKHDNDNSTPGCVGKSTDPLMATLARWKKDCSNTQVSILDNYNLLIDLSQ